MNKFPSKTPPHNETVQGTLPSEPKTREDFLKYSCEMTLDPNTAHRFLCVSERERTVTFDGSVHSYPACAERFDCWEQVLCKESLCGRCYWEVEWNCQGYWLTISVSYKRIDRKGHDNRCGFGCNDQSWCLVCFPALSFWHENFKTDIPGPPSSRIGVYVDHSAGTLSFYRVSDTMTLLHRVKTTFTQPLYAGFGITWGTVKLCDLNCQSVEHNQ